MIGALLSLECIYDSVDYALVSSPESVAVSDLNNAFVRTWRSVASN